jgi:hypothetical protein
VSRREPQKHRPVVSVRLIAPTLLLVAADEVIE